MPCMHIRRDTLSGAVQCITFYKPEIGNTASRLRPGHQNGIHARSKSSLSFDGLATTAGGARTVARRISPAAAIDRTTILGEDWRWLSSCVKTSRNSSGRENFTRTRRPCPQMNATGDSSRLLTSSCGAVLGCRTSDFRITHRLFAYFYFHVSDRNGELQIQGQM